MEDVIRTQTPAGQHIFLCGIAMNQRDMLDLFETVFLLSLDHATQLARLNTSSNAHRTDALRAQILAGRPVFEQEMRSVGAVVLDGRQPTPILVSRILHEVAPRSEPEP